MKIILDSKTHDYIEAKTDGDGKVDLSIRTLKDTKSTIVITAKLSLDALDKLVAQLILLKSRAQNE